MSKSMIRPSIPRIVASILAIHAELLAVASEAKQKYFRTGKRHGMPTKRSRFYWKRIMRDRKREKARRRHKQQMRREGKM